MKEISKQEFETLRLKSIGIPSVFYAEAKGLHGTITEEAFSLVDGSQIAKWLRHGWLTEYWIISSEDMNLKNKANWNEF